MDWVAEDIRLSEPVPGGASKLSQKQHLLVVYEASGKVPPDLEKWLDKPKELMYLWDWTKVHIHPLTYMELAAWAELTGRALSRWEVGVMIRLDRMRANG